MTLITTRTAKDLKSKTHAKKKHINNNPSQARLQSKYVEIVDWTECLSLTNRDVSTICNYADHEDDDGLIRDHYHCQDYDCGLLHKTVDAAAACKKPKPLKAKNNKTICTSQL